MQDHPTYPTASKDKVAHFAWGGAGLERCGDHVTVAASVLQNKLLDRSWIWMVGSTQRVIRRDLRRRCQDFLCKTSVGYIYPLGTCWVLFWPCGVRRRQVTSVLHSRPLRKGEKKRFPLSRRNASSLLPVTAKGQDQHAVLGRGGVGDLDVYLSKQAAGLGSMCTLVSCTLPWRRSR